MRNTKIFSNLKGDKTNVMKTKFLSALNELNEQAKDEMAALLSQKNEIILFEPDPEREGEWTRDIHDEIPDFAFYGKHGLVDYAAIRVVKKVDNEIIITGLLKGDSYAGEVTVNLFEMDSYHILALADYLLSENL